MSDVTLLFDRKIDISIPLSGYQLIPGYQGEVGLPLEAFLRLYAVSDQGNIILIAGPDHLSKLVYRINSEEEAWNFLRLFTGPKTHYLFQKETYIVDIHVLTPGEVAGIGAVSPEIARQIGYQPPQIRLEGHEYIAQRNLASASAARPSGSVTIIRRHEVLSQNGTYRFINDYMVGKTERINICIPYYE